MNQFFWSFAFFTILIVASGCSKSNNGPKQSPVVPSMSNMYLTDGAWIFKASYIRDSSYHSRFLPDSLVIAFSGADSANIFVDTVSTWFSNIKSFTSDAHFISSTVPGAPDTLLSTVSPYTFAFQLDTFLIKDLTDSQFVLEQYAKGTLTSEIDTLQKSIR